ncbi:hypothetical protein IOW38_004132 [Salmonella enterica]|nr:hypothetical protein [Salmonella enterica]EGM2645632.1 hypothetical protein [Salmonella enterica]EGM2983571.1 hypothetical protein [Salmonella enterica]EJU6033243.1 hypothetical protein [Salmonella enterica]
MALNALKEQVTTLQQQLTRQQEAVQAATAGQQKEAQARAGAETEIARAHEEVQRLTLLNHALSVKADMNSLTATPDVATRQATEALRSALAEAQQRGQALSEERDRLKVQLSTQQKQAGASMQQVATLTDRVNSLTAERDALKSQQMAAVKMAEAHTQSVSDLQKQVATLTEKMQGITSERDGLKAQLAAVAKNAEDDAQSAAGIQKRITDLAASREALEQQVTVLMAKNTELGKLNDALKTQAENRDQKQAGALVSERNAQQGMIATLTAKSDGLSAENDTLKAQLTELKKQVDTSAQQVSAAGTQVATLTAAREELQKQVATLTEKTQSVTSERDGLRVQLAAAAKTAREQTQSVTDMRRQLADLSASRDVLEKQATVLTGQAGPLAQQASAERVSSPVLSSEAQRQAYASGVMLAGTLKRTLALQKNLGVSAEPAALLAGVSDGVNGQVRQDDSTLNKSYQSLLTRLSSLEEGKYREGEKAIEKLTAGQKVLKRNRSVFFVQTRKGSQALKSGDTVTFDLTESVLNGRELRNNKGVRGTVGDGLPYLVREAMTFAGRGGEITVYCMASDVYPPEQIPEGLFGYTPLKFMFRVAK